MKPKIRLIVLFLFLLSSSYAVLALNNDPLVLFTDNISAAGTTLLLTDMEQQLLNRLNAATTTILTLTFSVVLGFSSF